MCTKEYIRKSTGKQVYQLGLVCKEEHYSLLERYLNRYNIKYHIMKSKGVAEYRTYRSRSDLLSAFIISKCGSSDDKHFPDIVKERHMWDILSGFIDSDGSVDKDKLRFFNTNKTLIDQIACILETLGIGFTVIKQPRDRIKDMYCLSINAEDLPRTKFSLLSPYKRDRYETLKERSRGRKVELGRDWFYKNKEILKQEIPKTTINRRFRNEWFWLYETELLKIKRKLG